MQRLITLIFILFLAVFHVNKWLLESVHELGRAAVILGLAFWMTEQQSLEHNSHVNFTSAMDRIPFLREMNDKGRRGRDRDRNRGAPVSAGARGNTARLDEALGVVASGSSVLGSKDRDDYYYLLAAVEAAKGNMESFASVLTDIEKAVIRANSPQSSKMHLIEVLSNLRRELEDIMCSTKGRMVNELVLAPFGCQLIWQEENRSGDIGLIPTHTQIFTPTASRAVPLETVKETGKDKEREKGRRLARSYDSMTSLGSTISTETDSYTRRSTPSWVETPRARGRPVEKCPVAVPVSPPVRVPVHVLYTKDTTNIITHLSNGRYTDGNTDNRRPTRALVPVEGPPKTPPAGSTVSARRGTVSRESDFTVAKQMDPVIRRFKQKLGIKSAPAPPRLGSRTTPFRLQISPKAGAFTIDKQNKMFASVQRNAYTLSPPRSQSPPPPLTPPPPRSQTPPPATASPTPKHSAQKNYLSTFIASPGKRQSQTVHRLSDTAEDRESLRREGAWETSNFSANAHRVSTPAGGGADRGVNHPGSGADGGCSLEFLTGGQRGPGQGYCVIAGVKAALDQTRQGSEGSVYKDTSIKSDESALLDYDDIYGNRDFLLETTDAQAMDFKNFRRTAHTRSDSHSSMEGDRVRGEGDLEGRVEESYRLQNGIANYDAGGWVASEAGSSRGNSPVSFISSLNTGSRVLPSVHVTPSFGFTNSYSEPVSLGRTRLTKFLLHAKEEREKEPGSGSSVVGDEMFRSAVTGDSPTGGISPLATDRFEPSGSSGVPTSQGSLSLLHSPDTAHSCNMSEAGMSPNSISRVDNYSNNPMKNSLCSPDSAAGFSLNASPSASRNMPAFGIRAPFLNGDGDDSGFVSVSARRDNLNRKITEVQTQKVNGGVLNGGEKDLVVGSGSIDIRGYNAEAAMLVKAKLSTPTPIKRRKTIEGVSAQIADRLRTFSEPSVPLRLF